MGLPMFPVFSSLMTVMMESPIGSFDTVAVMCAAWFLATWQYSRLLHGIWFGRTRLPFHTWEVAAGEAVILLVIAGVSIAAAVGSWDFAAALHVVPQILRRA